MKVRRYSISMLTADIEALLGLVIASFVGLVCVGLLGFVFLVWEWVYGSFHLHLQQRILLTLGWVPAIILEALSVRWMGHAMGEALHPRPVSIALLQKNRGLIFNLLTAVWWFAHGVAVVGAVDWIVTKNQFMNPNTFETAFYYVTNGMWLFGAMYASTTFLLLGLGAICLAPMLLHRVWSLRVPVDLTIMAVLLMLSARH